MNINALLICTWPVVTFVFQETYFDLFFFVFFLIQENINFLLVFN